MLATELVYDLNAAPGSKGRGLKQIIKDYNNYPEFVEKYKDQNGIEKSKFVMYDKLGDKKLSEDRLIELEEKYSAPRNSDVFKEKAVSEGYKGKQNIMMLVLNLEPLLKIKPVLLILILDYQLKRKLKRKLYLMVKNITTLLEYKKFIS